MWTLRIQLCGPLAVQRDGVRVESRIPGRQGRVVLGHLVANHDRSVTREELALALWGDDQPPDPDNALNSLLSKVRRVVGPNHVTGRTALRFVADDTVFVDVDHALDALHRAESHLALREWPLAWQPAHGAYHVARRTFLLGHDAEWISAWRDRLEDVAVRALECFAVACLAIGGPELAVAERAARALVDRAPFRESGYRVLMQALERSGNPAEGLRVYERLRAVLAAELGVAPGRDVAALHARLLGA